MNKLIPVLAAAWFACQAVQAQPPGAAAGSAREAAPIDLEGYWISVVTEDWMFRMVTPPPGETRGVPLNREGQRAAAAWDPRADIAAGEQCKAYGAPALLRIPGRLRFSWEGADTLLLEAEAGRQSRQLHFGESAASAPSRQGRTQARWERYPGAGGGKLVAETAALLPGYLRRNGVPYGADATLREYFSVYDAPNGDIWLVVTTEVTDPQYLSLPFVTSSHFKKLGQAEGERWWAPKDCQAM